jgi:hypothetical protein
MWVGRSPAADASVWSVKFRAAEGDFLPEVSTFRKWDA